MKLAAVLTVCAATSLSLAAAATTPAATSALGVDCTQEQRRTINKLLQQDVNPAKACYAKARGDITTLSTSRLCPLEECRDWLTYMAANTPVCIYDDTNFGRDFRSKAKDCGDPSASSGSGSNAGAGATTPKPKTPTTDGSDADGSEVGATTAPPKTRAPPKSSDESSSSGSGSSSLGIEPIATTESPDVTFPPEPTPTPTTRSVAPTPTSAASLAPVCAATVSVTVAAAALVL